MDRSSIIYLIGERSEKDKYNVLRKKEVRRQVYANIKSVTATEFFEGGRNGLKPQVRATVFLWDYRGEQIVEIKGVRYAVYRTYTPSTDEIELYLELRKGVQHADQGNA